MLPESYTLDHFSVNGSCPNSARHDPMFTQLPLIMLHNAGFDESMKIEASLIIVPFSETGETQIMSF